MTAKEMFEELGYDEIKNDCYYLDYACGDNVISFCKKLKTYASYCSGDKHSTCVYINVEEHNAITNQMKELGWLYE